MKQLPRRVGPFQSGAGFRQALERSRHEAFQRYHRQIRPGHLLLAVALTDDARVDAMLAALRITRVRLAERATLDLAPLPAHDGGPDLAFTPRSVQVLQDAALLAEKLEWGWLGAAHLLAALGEETGGTVPRALRDVGVTVSALHSALASAAQPLPPAPSEEPPIVWWDSRSTRESGSGPSAP